MGDQFAMLEAMVSAVMLLRRFEFKLDMPASEVGMTAAATIHTRNGLWCTVAERDVGKGAAASEAKSALVA